MKKNIFEGVKKKYPEYSPIRLWAAKEAIISDCSSTKLKNFDKAMHISMYNALHGKEYPEIEKLFLKYGYPHKLLRDIKEVLPSPKSTGKKDGVGSVAVIKSTIDFLPACVILMYVTRDKV